MNNTARFLGFLAILSVLVVVPSCKTGGGEPTGPGKAISCGGDALAHCAPDLLGPTNECLAGTGDVVACVTGFLKPAGCMGLDVLACMVRHEGSAASAAASANPNNTVDARRAERAREFIRREGVTFKD